MGAVHRALRPKRGTDVVTLVTARRHQCDMLWFGSQGTRELAKSSHGR